MELWQEKANMPSRFEELLHAALLLQEVWLERKDPLKTAFGAIWVDVTSVTTLCLRVASSTFLQQVGGAEPTFLQNRVHTLPAAVPRQIHGLDLPFAIRVVVPAN